MSSHKLNIGIGATAVVALILVLAYINRDNSGIVPNSSTPPVRHIESAQEKASRLTIMNELNRFHITSVSAQDLEDEEREVEQLTQVTRTKNALEKLTAEGRIDAARDKLVVAMQDWESALQSDSDTTMVRTELEAIAEQYDWLYTLSWLIILNHL